MGVPAQAAPGQRVLSQVHQVGQPREGHLQAGGQQGGVPAVGAAQEQARHELRDHGPRSQVLLPEGYPGQGGRPEASVPVRGCSQDWRHCRGGLRRRLSRDTQYVEKI